MAKVVVFGIGQLAEVAHFYLTHDSPHDVAAFTVDSEYLKADQHLGVPTVAFDLVHEIYPPDDFRMFVPVGYGNRNRNRELKYRQAKEKGYELITYICSRRSPGRVSPWERTASFLKAM